MESSVCIEQKGTVEEISGQHIRVKIHRNSSCGHCNAQGMCYMGETEERVIDISDFTDDIKAGDTVDIIMTRTLGNKAIVLGYMIPFVLLISVLLIMNLLGTREWLSGLVSLASLIPYFIILYLLRDRLRKTFTLAARKNVL